MRPGILIDVETDEVIGRATKAQDAEHSAAALAALDPDVGIVVDGRRVRVSHARELYTAEMRPYWDACR